MLICATLKLFIKEIFPSVIVLSHNLWRGLTGSGNCESLTLNHLAFITSPSSIIVKHVYYGPPGTRKPTREVSISLCIINGQLTWFKPQIWEDIHWWFLVAGMTQVYSAPMILSCSLILDTTVQSNWFLNPPNNVPLWITTRMLDLSGQRCCL